MTRGAGRAHGGGWVCAGHWPPRRSAWVSRPPCCSPPAPCPQLSARNSGSEASWARERVPLPFRQRLISGTPRLSLRYGPADTAASPWSCVRRSNEQAAALEGEEQRGGPQASALTPFLLTGKTSGSQEGMGQGQLLTASRLLEYLLQHLLQHRLEEEVCDPESLADASVKEGLGVTGGALASGR